MRWLWIMCSMTLEQIEVRDGCPALISLLEYSLGLYKLLGFCALVI